MLPTYAPRAYLAAPAINLNHTFPSHTAHTILKYSYSYSRITENHREHPPYPTPVYPYPHRIGSRFNEVIINAEEFTSSLPHAVEAFWVQSDHAWRQGWDYGGVNVREAHAAFNAEYGYDVPLLTLDRGNWDAPFAMLGG